MFHRLIGMSFKQWRSQYRIAWAIAAVQSGGRTLFEVIQDSGYRDRRAFERAFRRATGKTPGELHREAERAGAL
jgi:AraC family transcriptional regulator